MTRTYILPIIAALFFVPGHVHGKIPSFSAADLVLGAPDFETVSPAAASASAIYGADNRVLFFRNAASRPNGAAADGVLGQPNFVTATTNTTSRTLHRPGYGIATDADGGFGSPIRTTGASSVFPPTGLPRSLAYARRFPA